MLKRRSGFAGRARTAPLVIENVVRAVFSALVCFDRDGVDSGFGFVGAPVLVGGVWVMVLKGHDGVPVAVVRVEEAADG